MSYPYIHVGHGTSPARKSWEIAVLFRGDVDDAVREAIASSVPQPMDALAWKGRAALFGSHHGELVDAIDTWLLAAHQKSPIAAVIRLVDDACPTELSAWHSDSMNQLPPFLPYIAKTLGKGKNGAWYLEHACDLYRGWIAEQPLTEQKRLIGALDAEARRVLRTAGGIPRPNVRQRRDSGPSPLDEARAVWREVSSAGDPMEAFDTHFRNRQLSRGEYTLLNFGAALAEAQDWALLEEVARRALASPSSTLPESNPETDWRPHLLRALVHQGRLDDARAEVPRVALTGNITALLEYFEAGGGTTTEAALMYHAARFVARIYETPCDVKRSYPKPKDWAKQFDALLDRMIEPIWDLKTLSVGRLGRAAQLFESIGKDRLAEKARAARAEIERRDERRRALFWTEPERLTPEELEEKLGRQPKPLPKPEQVERLMQVVRLHVQRPDIVHGLYVLGSNLGVARSRSTLSVFEELVRLTPLPEAREYWLIGLDSALYYAFALKQFARAAAWADVARPFVREYPSIGHRAARAYVAVGRLDDALDMCRLAVESQYKDVDLLRKDTDLGPLHKHPQFQALFDKRRSKPSISSDKGAAMSVAGVIERLRAQGNAAKAGDLLEYDSPKPLAADAVAALRLPTGEPLPADLVEWLCYDASWLGLLNDDQKSFQGGRLRQLLEGWLTDMRGSDDEDVQEELEELVEFAETDDVLKFWLKCLPQRALADVHAVVIPSAGDQEHLLMLEPGRKSLRVLGWHKRIEFWWKYESFAAYLAHHFGFQGS